MSGSQRQLITNLLKLIKNIVDSKKDRETHNKNAYNTVKWLGYDKRFLTFVLSLTNKPLPNLGGGKIGRRKPISYGRVGDKVDIHNAILKVAPKKGFVCAAWAQAY